MSDDDTLFLPGDDFVPWHKPVRVRWDDDEDDPNATTYTAATHGPDPVPDWVLIQDAARQRELGILKTGKEADVHLVERFLPGTERRNLLAAKRYRDNRGFRNDVRYRAGRRTGDRRIDLAVASGSAFGQRARATAWARTEFSVLCSLWTNGVPVPYPVQLLGEEIMLEFLGDDEGAAPRLVETKPTVDEAARWYDQVAETILAMAELGVVHGDLSPYNLLVWEDVVYVIDLPQAQHGAADPETIGLLEHDVLTVCRWFEKHGVTTNGAELLADALVAAM